MTIEEVRKRVDFLMSQRIKTNSFVISKQVKTPNITSIDVYEKVVYDAVRRDSKQKDKMDKKNAVEGVTRNNPLTK